MNFIRVLISWKVFLRFQSVCLWEKKVWSNKYVTISFDCCFKWCLPLFSIILDQQKWNFKLFSMINQQNTFRSERKKETKLWLKNLKKTPTKNRLKSQLRTLFYLKSNSDLHISSRSEEMGTNQVKEEQKRSELNKKNELKTRKVHELWRKRKKKRRNCSICFDLNDAFFEFLDAHNCKCNIYRAGIYTVLFHAKANN